MKISSLAQIMGVRLEETNVGGRGRPSCPLRADGGFDWSGLVLMERSGVVSSVGWKLSQQVWGTITRGLKNTLVNWDNVVPLKK